MSLLTSIKALYMGTAAMCLAQQNRKSIQKLEMENASLQRQVRQLIYVNFDLNCKRTRDVRRDIIAVKPSRN